MCYFYTFFVVYIRVEQQNSEPKIIEYRLYSMMMMLLLLLFFKGTGGGFIFQFLVSYFGFFFVRGMHHRLKVEAEISRLFLPYIYIYYDLRLLLLILLFVFYFFYSNIQNRTDYIIYRLLVIFVLQYNILLPPTH